jgi:hypothetical protein
MKPYYRFYSFFIGLFLTLCGLWIWGVYAQLGVSIPGKGWESYMQYTFKKDRAESIKNPKLIVMSGSNGLCSISTEMLAEGLGISSVNMATNVPIGLKYILHQTWPVVKSGDWILAPLEYSLYGESVGGEKPTGAAIDYVFAHDPDYFRVKEPMQKVEFILGMSIKRFFHGILYTVFPFSRTLGMRQALPLNGNGDTTDNVGQKFDGVTNAFERYLLQKGNLSEAALRMLSDFIDECRRNGVQFLATYPSLLHDKAYLSEMAQEKITAIEAFYTSKSVPILETFEESLYPVEDIYDACYHLNTEGREKRMRLLLKLLKPYISQRSGQP